MDLNAHYEYEAIDGFLLLQNIGCNLTFGSLAIREYEALRRSGRYRSRAWTIPESSSFVIPALDAYEYQIRCVPGAAIWGYSFVSESGGPFSFQISETCTDVPLFSEVIRADNFALQNTLAELSNGQQFLPRLLIIPEPGLINVQIASQQATDASGIQLVLWGGEPACEG